MLAGFESLKGKIQAYFSKNLLNRFLPNIFPVLLRDLSHQEAIFTQDINCLLKFGVANISLMNTVEKKIKEQSLIKVLIFLSIHHNLAVTEVIQSKMPRGCKEGREKKISVFIDRALLIWHNGIQSKSQVQVYSNTLTSCSQASWNQKHSQCSPPSLHWPLCLACQF